MYGAYCCLVYSCTPASKWGPMVLGCPFVNLTVLSRDIAAVSVAVEPKLFRNLFAKLQSIVATGSVSSDYSLAYTIQLVAPSSVQQSQARGGNSLDVQSESQACKSPILNLFLIAYAYPSRVGSGRAKAIKEYLLNSGRDYNKRVKVKCSIYKVNYRRIKELIKLPT